MPKLKPHTIIPTSQEDAQINRAITEDPDTSDLTKSPFLKRVAGVLQGIAHHWPVWVLPSSYSLWRRLGRDAQSA